MSPKPEFSFSLTARAPTEDLMQIRRRFQALAPSLDFKNERILLTGATGFFGKWLTQSLLHLNDELSLGNELHIVTRNTDEALKRLPWLKDRAEIRFIESDIRSLQSEDHFTSIIHGAATASRTLNENDPAVMFETILEGTKKILKIAENSGCRRLQVISSGAVYGTQPAMMSQIPETYAGAPDTRDSKSAYGEAKRAAEFLSITAARRHGFKLSVPRCFAFVGPYLPLDNHFAAGNFIKAVIDGKTIQIGGDGTPYRSYLYAADLVVWLLVSLLHESSPPVVNVGSPESTTIRELADTVHQIGCEVFPERANLNPSVSVALPPQGKVMRYVPDVHLAYKEMNLEAWTPLNESLRKSLAWLKGPGR